MSSKTRDIIILLLSIITVISVINIIFNYLNHGKASLTIISIAPNLNISFATEPLGLLFMLMVSVLWLITHIYSIGYMNFHYQKIDLSKFYTLILFSIFCSFGVALASNLLTLFVFYEFLTICTYFLIVFDPDENKMKAGRIYLTYLFGSSLAFFLPAIILTYSYTGSITFTYGGVFSETSQYIGIMFLLYLFGIAKTAIIPLHSWLPSAMVAPIPVSALLHAVAVVKTGIFCILKIVIYIFSVSRLNEYAQNSNLSLIIQIVAGTTIIIASILALAQNSIKKLLAYSTISQLSYSILAISIFTKKAVIAAVFHMISHAISKITLFFAAGNIYTATGKTDISEISGIAKIIPVTMIAFLIGALSMIGIPPASGFLSKFYIFTASWGMKNNYIIIIVLLLTSLISTSYFSKLLYNAYFEKTKEDISINKLSFYMQFSIILTSLAIILLNIFAQHIISFIS
ncbi:MAG: complex I subunit 5 family protein [Alphaproteobacteria bacterium]